MIANKILIISLLFITPFAGKSQGIKEKKGKIYFLIDTVKIPKNDLIYKITTTNKYVYYEILCPCFYMQQHPGFISNQQPTTVSDKEIKDYTFINLKDFLFKLCKEQEGVARHNDIYFIEKIKNKYYSRQVIMNSISREE